MNENNIVWGTGAKVWMILCIVFSILSLLANLVAGNFALLACGFLGVAAYLWLFLKKTRMAFYLIIAYAVIILILNLAVYKTGFFAILGLVNPLITYLLISKQWPEME